jgi:molybdopterin/thiamine biosynthesis adenylyltransferase
VVNMKTHILAILQVAKNLALAGIGTMVLVDGSTLGEDHGSFLIPADMEKTHASVSQLCSKGLKEMNPLIHLINIDKNPSEYLESACLNDFDAVLAFDIPAHLISKADSQCADLNIPFASCNARGTCGWIFMNPQNRKYVVEVCLLPHLVGSI